MSDPLISIIIPCYNGERFVADAIRSALGQTYPAKEVIVVNDGSKDSSLQVIKSFGPAIRWLDVPNGGASVARNLGLEIACGDIIQFLDADDLLYPEKLTRQLPLLLEDPGGMVFCQTEVVEMETNKRLGTWGRTLGKTDPVVYVFTSVLQTAAPLHWKANLLKVGGFRKEMPPCDDPDLHFRLACHGVRFHQLPEVLYTSRRVQGSLSKSNLARGLQQEIRLAHDSYDMLKRTGGFTDQRVRAIAGFLANAARRAIRNGLKDRCREILDQAVQMHPQAIEQAYGRGAKFLLNVLGPIATEHLVGWKRMLLKQGPVG